MIGGQHFCYGCLRYRYAEEFADHPEMPGIKVQRCRRCEEIHRGPAHRSIEPPLHVPRTEGEFYGRFGIPAPMLAPDSRIIFLDGMMSTGED